MIVAHATGGPTRNPVSTENGQKSVLLRNVNRIMNPNHFQLKRFSAQSLGTTYVYDFPELFQQVIRYM